MRGPSNPLIRHWNVGFFCEGTQVRQDQVRRLSDGTVDYDYYKLRARTMRQAAVAAQMRALSRFVMRSMKALVSWGTRVSTLPPPAARHAA